MIKIALTFSLLLATTSYGASNYCNQFSSITHKKIFETFSPKLAASDVEGNQLLAGISAGTLQYICSQQTYSLGLSLIGNYLTQWTSDSNAQAEAYYSLINSSDALLAKTAKEMRMLYIVSLYSSEFGFKYAQYDNKSKQIYHPQLSSFAKRYVSELKNEIDSNSITFNHAKNELIHKKGEFDYIVIGSGPAGSVIAHQLSEKGHRVILVDKGSFPIPGAVDSTMVRNFMEMNGQRFNSSGSILIKNAQSAGGGSSVNVDLAFSPLLPIIQDKIRGWEDKGFIPEGTFTYDQMSQAYSWVKNIVGTRKLDRSEINKNNMVLWEGSQKLGWTPNLYDLNRDTEDERAHEVSGKRSAVEKILIPALKNKKSPLYFLSDSETLNIVYKKIDGEYQAQGIRVKQNPFWDNESVIKDLFNLNIPIDSEYIIRAKNVIVAAGALGSPTVLIKSGIDKINPMIGKGMILHPSIPIVAEFNHKIESSQGLTASVYNAHFASQPNHGYIFESMDADPGYLALMIQGNSSEIFNSVKKYQNYAGFGVMLVDSVNLNNKLSVKNNSIQIDYELSAKDKQRLISGIKNGVKIMFKAGAKKVAIPSIETKQAFFENESEMLKALESLELRPSTTIVTSAHMQATNKMGSVVDSDFRVKQFKNLFVVDGSVFPASIGANPMQSIYTWAKMFSDSIK